MGKEVDVTIYMGDSFEQEYVWKSAITGLPISLTGWTATFELFDSAGTLLDTLTSAGGDITLTADTGSIVVAMDDSATAMLSAQVGSYKLHMDYAATSYRERLAWGDAVIVA